jgi:DNA-binding response OmpR family regulator
MSDDKKRILIIDDSTDDIHFVMENLKHDFAVLVATSGQKGLEIAAKDPQPDVILLDVMMPGMDGYETCRQLKENSSTENIDVIFVSAHDTMKEKMAGYDAGGSDYLIKPVQPEVLLQKVNLAIHNKQIRLETSAQKDMAFKTAMIALSNSGEQGVIMDFLRKNSLTTTTRELGNLIVNSINHYELDNSLQIRSNLEIVNVGTKTPIPPLEEELLMRQKDNGRIIEWANRVIFNFGSISLLVKNMPEDKEKLGRLRDHIAILLESAEDKLSSMEIGEKLAQLIIDSNKVLQEVEYEQKSYKVTAQQITDNMLIKLEASFHSCGLTEDQESLLLNIVQTGIDQSLEHFEQGLTIDQKMTDIFNRLAQFYFVNK